MTRNPFWRALAALAVAGLAIGATTPAQAAGSHALIAGSGSSWSANAVNQWIADVQSQGLQVVFTSSGSAQGRKDFANRQNDFAVTDIGFQGRDPATNADDSPDGRGYAYLPIVAGGTSFPYQLQVAGQLVRNLRLSGATLAGIFTGKITNWNAPQITADNNGRKFPSIPIIPVVHSEGSGSTAQFTRYLATEFPNEWTSINKDQNGNGLDELTEYFPASKVKNAVAQNGSDGVMNFVTSKAANGAIGYDEYSYALGKDYPVAKIENKAGYFTLPTQYNVAVALLKAKINYDKNSKDYLLQDLDNVYVDKDVRTYPLSSYSYQVIPIASNDKTMTTAKRQTLADFDFYSICTGQTEMGPIGYSPLPVNLVQAGFKQIAELKTADSGVDLTKRNVNSCHNPTFVPGDPKGNHLAQIAPKPPACDKAGAGPCTDAGDPGTSGGGGHGGNGGGGNGGGTGGGGGGANPTNPGGGANPTTPGGGGGQTDPTNPGQVADPTNPTNTTPGGTTTDTSNIVAQPTEIPTSQNTDVLGPLAGILFLLILIGPPMLARRLRTAPPKDSI
ncbi:MAG: substrate-binding domain-containing protein [Frankiaceae bacterium]|nr:substrate-binding domain-containing protein [Frankiaceae bacterium]MBV9869956.1 substrate-binding domain-containing protein [Frankiaceae bacterium]